jgi:class 3 adenylate cyclase
LISKKNANSPPVVPKAGPPEDNGAEIEVEYLVDYLTKHAPRGWETDRDRYLKLLKEYLDHEKPLRMVVLSADIRKSTFLMQESVSFRKFAQLMGRFIDRTAEDIRNHGGWFDKFTGDGFLAYWLMPEDNPDYSEILTVGETLLHTFRETGMDIFRKNCRNFPAGVGLSLGIDAGDAYMVTMAGDLTIVGPPVVGAVRMVDAAEKPWETVCNVFLGYALYENRERLMARDQIEVRREYRKTKEYEEQEVYPVIFNSRYITKPQQTVSDP